MNRYVVLHHTDHGEPHYDLLIPVDEQGPLLTWRMSDWPLEDGISLTRLPDHRRHYLTYEGPISGGRGQVRRVAQGVCAVDLGPPCRVRFDDAGTWELAETARRLT